ncbi:MAG: copper chaperone PCu(A)C, partial [Asticcacaulis sp.]|nr:copper chaperone PCu(A)C [Asticcacaulis sp.]
NPNTAAYVTIKNGGELPDRLVSAHCDCAGTATLHEMVMKGDAMDMREPEGGFTIAPGQTLTFAPGGNHIMLSDLTNRPAEGQIVNLTLTFEKAGPVTLAMPVSNTPLARKDASDGHDHMKM